MTDAAEMTVVVVLALVALLGQRASRVDDGPGEADCAKGAMAVTGLR